MALNALTEYNPAQYNVLMPETTTQQVGPMHQLRVTLVSINPNPAAGEVFKVGSKFISQDNFEDVLSLAKPAIMKISQAAGIVWNWRESRFLSLTRDYACYEAVGAMRMADGSWLPLKATKEVDLAVIEEEVHEANLKKARDLAKAKLNGLTQEQWAAAQTKSNMIQWRKNKGMRTETGAMLRVVRALLGMRQQYSPAELCKPFAVPRVEFSPDVHDPAVKQMILQHGMRATGELFGGTTPQIAAPAQEPAAFIGSGPSWGNASNVDSGDANGDYGSIGGDDDLDPPAPSVPASAPQQPVTAPQQPAQATSEDVCEYCGQVVSPGVAKYSRGHFDGRVICMGCRGRAGVE